MNMGPGALDDVTSSWITRGSPQSCVMKSPISSIKLAPAPGHSASSTPKKWPKEGPVGQMGQIPPRKSLADLIYLWYFQG